VQCTQHSQCEAASPNLQAFAGGKLPAIFGTACIRRSCRVRLEAHNARQRERWTAAGSSSRRRPRQAAAADSLEDDDHRPPAGLPSAHRDLQHPQQPDFHRYAAAPADQARAAFTALFGVETAPTVTPFAMPGQVRCAVSIGHGNLLPPVLHLYGVAGPSVQSVSSLAAHSQYFMHAHVVHAHVVHDRYVVIPTQVGIGSWLMPGQVHSSSTSGGGGGVASVQPVAGGAGHTGHGCAADLDRLLNGSQAALQAVSSVSSLSDVTLGCILACRFC
jgi:hypothetical protein